MDSSAATPHRRCTVEEVPSSSYETVCAHSSSFSRMDGRWWCWIEISTPPATKKSIVARRTDPWRSSVSLPFTEISNLTTSGCSRPDLKPPHYHHESIKHLYELYKLPHDPQEVRKWGFFGCGSNIKNRNLRTPWDESDEAESSKIRSKIQNS